MPVEALTKCLDGDTRLERCCGVLLILRPQAALVVIAVEARPSMRWEDVGACAEGEATPGARHVLPVLRSVGDSSYPSGCNDSLPLESLVPVL